MFRPVGNFFKETLFEILSRGSLDRISAIEIVKKSLAVPEISLLLPKMPPWDPSVRGRHAQVTPSIEASVTLFSMQKFVTLASIEGVT